MFGMPVAVFTLKDMSIFTFTQSLRQKFDSARESQFS